MRLRESGNDASVFLLEIFCKLNRCQDSFNRPAEADQVFYWMEKGDKELTIMRNGGPNDQKTTYNIFPANR